MSEASVTAKEQDQNIWEDTTLGDVSEFVMGQAPPGSECNKKGKGTLFVKAGEFGGLYPVAKEWTTKPLKHGKDGDVFICVVGATSGKLNLGRDCAIGRSVAAIRPNEGVDTKYIYYQLQTWVMKLRAASTGSAQGVISKAKLRDVPFKLTDEANQRRIVAEIEKQFSRLDEAVASLKRVKANLKRYRAAVLKAAVEGKLTEEWRRQNPDVEPGSKLLERILAERRTKWEEAELAKMKAKGKEPKNDKWKEKYKEPTEPETDELPKLPIGWQWSTFERLAERVTVGHVGPMKNEYVDEGVPFLRSQNVRENRYDPAGLKYITEEFHQKLSKSSLKPGDLAIVRSGSVGVTCVIPEQLNVANCSDLVIVKKPLGIASEYGAYYMNSVVNTRVAAGKVGVALTHFNTKSVAQMPVPIPSKPEQAAIVDLVGEKLSVIESLDNQFKIYMRRSERLKSSILSQAFTTGIEF